MESAVPDSLAEGPTQEEKELIDDSVFVLELGGDVYMTPAVSQDVVIKQPFVVRERLQTATNTIQVNVSELTFVMNNLRLRTSRLVSCLPGFVCGERQCDKKAKPSGGESGEGVDDLLEMDLESIIKLWDAKSWDTDAGS